MSNKDIEKKKQEIRDVLMEKFPQFTIEELGFDNLKYARFSVSWDKPFYLTKEHFKQLNELLLKYNRLLEFETLQNEFFPEGKEVKE